MQVREAFEAGIQFLEDADRVLHLSIAGIARLQGIGRLAEELAKLDEFYGKPTASERVAEAQELARLAAEEVASDFPLLRAHSVVAMWSVLEAVIPRFAAAWLVEHPQTLERAEFQRLRVPAAALMRTDDQQQRMDLIIRELTAQQGSASKRGVGQFEGVLSALGLSFGVSDEIRRNMFEISQVRNLVVHQLSVVDAKFAEECPWLGLNIGDHLKVTYEMYNKYRSAIHDYLLTVINQVAAKQLDR